MFERLKGALEVIREEVLELRRRARERKAARYYHYEARRPSATRPSSPSSEALPPDSDDAVVRLEAPLVRRSSKAKLIARLRDPQGIRDAIVLSEVLAKPVALRRRR